MSPIAIASIATMALTLSLSGIARAADDDAATARVVLTTDAKIVETCAAVGTVSDDSVKDLRKKVVRAGGDTALLSFLGGNRIDARAYRCASSPTVVAVPPAPPPATSPPRLPDSLPSLDAVRAEPARVLVVTDVNLVRHCQIVGTVADNELQDLQKKAARVGGNVALLTPERRAKGGYFGAQDYMTADAYRCDAAR